MKNVKVFKIKCGVVSLGIAMLACVTSYAQDNKGVPAIEIDNQSSLNVTMDNLVYKYSLGIEKRQGGINMVPGGKWDSRGRLLEGVIVGYAGSKLEYHFGSAATSSTISFDGKPQSLKEQFTDSSDQVYDIDIDVEYKYKTITTSGVWSSSTETVRYCVVTFKDKFTPLPPTAQQVQIANLAQNPLVYISTEKTSEGFSLRYDGTQTTVNDFDFNELQINGKPGDEELVGRADSSGVLQNSGKFVIQGGDAEINVIVDQTRTSENYDVVHNGQTYKVNVGYTFEAPAGDPLKADYLPERYIAKIETVQLVPSTPTPAALTPAPVLTVTLDATPGSNIKFGTNSEQTNVASTTQRTNGVALEIVNNTPRSMSVACITIKSKYGFVDCETPSESLPLRPGRIAPGETAVYLLNNKNDKIDSYSADSMRLSMKNVNQLNVLFKENEPMQISYKDVTGGGFQLIGSVKWLNRNGVEICQIQLKEISL